MLSREGKKRITKFFTHAFSLVLSACLVKQLVIKIN